MCGVTYADTGQVKKGGVNCKMTKNRLKSD